MDGSQEATSDFVASRVRLSCDEDLRYRLEFDNLCNSLAKNRRLACSGWAEDSEWKRIGGSFDDAGVEGNIQLVGTVASNWTLKSKDLLDDRSCLLWIVIDAPIDPHEVVDCLG